MGQNIPQRFPGSHCAAPHYVCQQCEKRNGKHRRNAQHLLDAVSAQIDPRHAEKAVDQNAHTECVLQAQRENSSVVEQRILEREKTENHEAVNRRGNKRAARAEAIKTRQHGAGKSFSKRDAAHQPPECPAKNTHQDSGQHAVGYTRKSGDVAADEQLHQCCHQPGSHPHQLPAALALALRHSFERVILDNLAYVLLVAHSHHPPASFPIRGTGNTAISDLAPRNS